MKRIIISSLAILSVVSIAGAQGYMFNTNLTVGSTGPDVSALQTWLIGQGYSIPSIQSGAVSKGRFGSQTKAAVQQYQKSAGLPSTGFVGPLTRGKLNNGTPAASVSISSVSVSTTTPVVSVSGPVSTPGVVGTLAVSLWSTPSGIVAYKGQSYDVAAYKVQASASDMAIQNLTFDFDVRLWLYASAITIKDDLGNVVGQLTSLNQGNFSELTVGSDYRVSVPVNNYVVRATQSRYLTVNISFLPTSDRASGTINVLNTQIRSVDGTGVTDTETSTGGARSYTYEGSGAGSLISTLSSSNPSIGFVEISSGTVTQNVPLAIFSLKSQNAPATLNSLKIDVSISGNGNPLGTFTNLFNTLSLTIGSTTVNGSIGPVSGTAGGYQTALVTFSNFSTTLPADTYIDATLGANISADTGSRFEGIVASSTLDLSSASNISIVDASFKAIPVNSIVLVSNQQQFTESNITLGGYPTVTYGAAINNTSTGSTTQQFKLALPLVAGKNAIYISKSAYTAIGTTTSPSGMTITPLDFSDDTTNGDGSTYFYIAPGQAKTFTATYQASGKSTTAGVFQLVTLNYGTDQSALGGVMYNPDVTDILTATLFH